jgi:ubiquinone/menaquinone biosynthesis C-methylase UbiE
MTTSADPGGGPEPFDAQATYDAAAGDYEDASRDYWQYLSRRAVEALALRPGERVLDAPCGTGPSVVAAAEDVGPGGQVVGVDFAPAMLGVANEKVAARGLSNVELRPGDMTSLGLPAGSFDAVVSVLGIFFLDDMPAAVRGLWDLVRPGGGRLVVAVLGEAFFDPMRDVFVEAVAAVRPGLHVHEPWRRTEDPAVFRQVLAEGGVGEVELTSADDRLPLPSPDDWWRIVLGTGLRRTVMSLEPAEADAVRERCDAHIRGRGVREVVLGTHLGRAVKT